MAVAAKARGAKRRRQARRSGAGGHRTVAMKARGVGTALKVRGTGRRRAPRGSFDTAYLAIYIHRKVVN